jgi:hypothetical protein
MAKKISCAHCQTIVLYTKYLNKPGELIAGRIGRLMLRYPHKADDPMNLLGIMPAKEGKRKIKTQNAKLKKI